MNEVKHQNFLTDANLSFLQKIASAQNVDAVALNVYSKDTCVFYKNGVNVEIENENLQRQDWHGRLIVYKVLNQGQPVPEKTMSEYRQEKANTKFK